MLLESYDKQGLYFVENIASPMQVELEGVP